MGKSVNDFSDAQSPVGRLTTEPPQCSSPGSEWIVGYSYEAQIRSAAHSDDVDQFGAKRRRAVSV